MKKIDAMAYARKWHIDKEEPYKVRREKDNRLVWHRKFRFMALTNGRIFPDDEPLYTREALEAVAAHMRDIVCAEASRTLGVEWFWMDADFKKIIEQLTGE